MSLVEAIPAAVGIAANPPAVIAVLLLLSSSSSKRPAVAFVGGWVVGLALVAFVLLSSVTVLPPLLYSVVARRRGDDTMATVRGWLVRNGSAITAIVLLALGVLLIAGSVEKLWRAV